MGSPAISSKILRFGVFELNLEEQKLRKSGALLRLSPQPFKVLSLLAARSGQVVTREELRNRLWGNEVFVDFEQGLNYCIRQIRAVLGDDAQTPRYIETIPRVGYRFLVAVDGIAEEPIADAKAGVAPAKQRKWILIASLASAVVLGLIAASVYLIRVRASHRFTEKDTLVLAEFTNNTGDAGLDDVLKQGLTIQLEQSPYLNILSNYRIASTLRLMNRAGARMTSDVANEVCQRTNSKAMLSGTISNVGSHYLLALRATNCHTGDRLGSAQEEAEDRDKILYALQKAGNELRQNLGESLASVSRFNKPLPEATTSSLEALKAYATAASTSREGALAPLQRAVELDPNFAQAWAALGVRYRNFGQHALANSSLKRAFDLRDRVSDRERLYIEAHYYVGVTGEILKANQVYQHWIEMYPDDFTPYGNLGYNYANMGYYELALSASREAVRLFPDFATFNGNLEGNYLALNRLDEARALYEQAQARGVDGIALHSARYYVAFLQADPKSMQEQVAWASGKPGDEDWLLSAESDSAAYAGALSRAHDFSQRAVASARRNESPETAALWQMNEALRLAEFGYPDRCRLAAAKALALAEGPDVRLMAALAYARSGDAAQARKLADELNKDRSSDTLTQGYWLPAIRGAIELDRRNPERAIELLQTAGNYELGSTEIFQVGTMYPVYLRGLAYLRAKRGREAVMEFQKILDHRSVVVNFPLASLARLQIARAKAMNHEDDAARKSYESFLAIWNDADSDLPLLREAKAEYARLMQSGHSRQF